MDTKRHEEKQPAVTPVISPMTRYAADFEKVFTNMVKTGQDGHTGDIVPRAQPYEP